MLFDVDGTLCDSDPLHHYAFREMLQEVILEIFVSIFFNSCSYSFLESHLRCLYRKLKYGIIIFVQKFLFIVCVISRLSYNLNYFEGFTKTEVFNRLGLMMEFQ